MITVSGEKGCSGGQWCMCCGMREVEIAIAITNRHPRPDGIFTLCMPCADEVTLAAAEAREEFAHLPEQFVEKIAGLMAQVVELKRQLTNAEGDARILAHAYEHDSRPPTDVVDRALAYRAGRDLPNAAKEPNE